MSKKVGVIIPIYNAAELLGECLDSVCNQSYMDFEVLLVDDGSTDERVQTIIQNYTQKDSRFSTIKIANSGQAVARNLGIEHFVKNNRVDYIIFLDSDDTLEPECIGELVESIGSADLVWYDFRYIFRSVKPHNELTIMEKYGFKARQMITARQWLEESAKAGLNAFACGCWAMISVEYLNRINLRFLDAHGEDNHFGIMLFIQANQIQILPKKLYNYMIRQDSTINYGGKSSVQSTPIRLRKYLKDFYYNPMMLQKYYRAGGAAVMLGDIVSKFRDDRQIYELLELTFLNRLCMLGLNLKNFPSDPFEYNKYLPLVQEYARAHSIGAFALVHSSTAYWIGSSVIATKSSLKALLNVPKYIYKIIKDRRYTKEVKFDLESFWDKDYAQKVLKHRSYKIGKVILNLLSKKEK